MKGRLIQVHEVALPRSDHVKNGTAERARETWDENGEHGPCSVSRERILRTETPEPALDAKMLVLTAEVVAAHRRSRWSEAAHRCIAICAPEASASATSGERA